MGKQTKTTLFGGFRGLEGPIYWDFGEKTTKNPDTSSAFFEDFWPSDIRGIGPDIREISEKHGFWGVLEVQKHSFLTHFARRKI